MKAALRRTTCFGQGSTRSRAGLDGRLWRLHGERTQLSLLETNVLCSSITTQFSACHQPSILLPWQDVANTSTRQQHQGHHFRSSIAAAASAVLFATAATTTERAQSEQQQQGRSYNSNNNAKRNPSSQLFSGQSEELVNVLVNRVFSDTSDDDNPLWPNGCNDEDVKAFVTQVLQDPTINVPAIPDAVERLIYKTTVRLVLNTFYWLLSKFHNVSFLDHKLVLGLDRVTMKEKPKLMLKWDAVEATVDEQALQQVADRLLQNQAVNNTLIPDVVERQIYINCLRLVFRLIDTLLASFTIQVCGYAFVMDLVPADKTSSSGGGTVTRKSALSSTLTTIDLDKIREVARRHSGIVEEDVSEFSFLDRWSIQKKFLAQLYSCIYALLLGILDDVLGSTEIKLLGDRILLDIIPLSSNLSAAAAESKSEPGVLQGGYPQEKPSSEKDGAELHTGSFLFGFGVGASTVVAATAAFIFTVGSGRYD
jgi:hypothetical protein